MAILAIDGRCQRVRRRTPNKGVTTIYHGISRNYTLIKNSKAETEHYACKEMTCRLYLPLYLTSAGSLSLSSNFRLAIALTSLDHPLQPWQQKRLKFLFARRPRVVHGEVDTSAGGVNFHVTRASKLECRPYNEDILMANITMPSFVCCKCREAFYI